MSAAPELIFLCKEKELARFRDFSEKQKISAKFVFDANDVASTGSASALVVSESLWTHKAARQLGSLTSPPIIFLYGSPNEKPVPAKFQQLSYIPMFWHEGLSPREILSQAEQSQRKLRRILALREHQSRGWDFEKNPALFLITNLVKECSLAEHPEDVLKAVLSLRAVLDFQFAAFFTLSEQDDSAWVAFAHSPQKLQKVSHPSPVNWSALLTKPEPQILSPFSEEASGVSPAGDPWSSAILMPIQPQVGGRKKSEAAVVVLFRNELLPFSEKEAWLLEMALGPLTLALEKASMLERIKDASREWRSTFDAISEPITVIDENFSIVKANKAFARVVNADIKEVKDRKCYSLLANRRSPCEGCPVKNGSPSEGSKIQDRNRRDLLAWSYNVRVQKEDFNFLFYRNLEKENQLRSTLIQSEKMAALGKLVGSIAHEVNNPLAGILSTCQISLSEPDLLRQVNALEDIQEILSAAERSKAIIDNLLGFTEHSDTKMSLDIGALIQSTLSLCKSALRQTKLVIDVATPLPRVRGTAGVLQQILFNLITNALHAMDGAGTLTIRAVATSDEVLIYIDDNGPGIDPARLKVIFDPFHTTKVEGQGTGLGLSIVRNLTVKMGGEISVASKAGKGTSFCLKFPVERGHA